MSVHSFLAIEGGACQNRGRLRCVIWSCDICIYIYIYILRFPSKQELECRKRGANKRMFKNADERNQTQASTDKCRYQALKGTQEADKHV